MSTLYVPLQSLVQLELSLCCAIERAERLDGGEATLPNFGLLRDSLIKNLQSSLSNYEETLLELKGFGGPRLPLRLSDFDWLLSVALREFLFGESWVAVFGLLSRTEAGWLELTSESAKWHDSWSPVYPVGPDACNADMKGILVSSNRDSLKLEICARQSRPFTAQIKLDHELRIVISSSDKGAPLVREKYTGPAGTIWCVFLFGRMVTELKSGVSIIATKSSITVIVKSPESIMRLSAGSYAGDWLSVSGPENLGAVLRIPSLEPQETSDCVWASSPIEKSTYFSCSSDFEVDFSLDCFTGAIMENRWLCFPESEEFVFALRRLVDQEGMGESV